MDRRVRTLSLGERMRCEVVAAHQLPKVLLLDEPTIGLDVVAKISFGNFYSGGLRMSKPLSFSRVTI